MTKPISAGSTFASTTIVWSAGTTSTTVSPGLTTLPLVEIKTLFTIPSIGARICVLSALSAATLIPSNAATYSDFTSDNMVNLIKAIGITILPYNGYQSVVQMSEEVEDTDDVPKGMMISGFLTIFVYCLLAVAVISILGLSKTGKTTNPYANTKYIIEI